MMQSMSNFAIRSNKIGEKQMLSGTGDRDVYSVAARTLRAGASILAVGVMLTASATHARAQATSAQAAPQEGLEEVVVTARRVEERQQTTPISVTSLSAATLKSHDINRIQGLDQIAPNLIIDEGTASGFGAIIYIRGVGAISVTSYSDPPVSVYLDGVVQAAARFRSSPRSRRRNSAARSNSATAIITSSIRH